MKKERNKTEANSIQKVKEIPMKANENIYSYLLCSMIKQVSDTVLTVLTSLVVVETLHVIFYLAE